MNARPILFSSDMVRALLAGTKTQTRRAIKAPTTRGAYILSFNHGTPEWNFGPDDRKPNGDLRWHRCPYGEPGDLLWVRESHYVIGEYAGAWPGSRWTHYLADGSNNLGDKDHQWTGPWKPSIHMPRASSRLTLRITERRLQRLHEIDEADALAEGVPRDEEFPHWNPAYCPVCKGEGVHARGSLQGMSEVDCQHCDSARKRFQNLWRSINGEGSWAANPWDWAITFEVIRENVDVVMQRQQAVAA